MKKIGIIGGGIFGVSCALELSKEYEKEYNIVLFEKTGKLLSGASASNHLRHHYGYHYPRSKKTALESIKARDNFEKEYGGCICRNFPAYYGISKIGSKTTADEFLKFCNELNLPYSIEFPKKEYLNRPKIDLCIKVPEPVYDPDKLGEIAYTKLKKTNAKLRFNHEIIKGTQSNNKKLLTIKSEYGIKSEEFDYIINATYCDFNKFNKMLDFPQKKVLYELIELLEIKLPLKEKVGLTILDGEFSSCLPRGDKDTFTLGHVKESVLEATVSNDINSAVLLSKSRSNKEKILQKGTEDFPIIKNAELVNSIFVARVVKADVDDSDERPTEITDYGNGIYSIFAGKVITCVDTAKEIARRINTND